MNNTISLKPRHILICERDRMVRSLLVDFLEEEGFGVIGQDRVPDATSLRHNTPDLLILEIPKAATSPELDFVSHMKLDSHTANIPILALCRTCPSNDVAAWTQQHGMAGLLRKPFDLDELLKSIEIALDTSNQLVPAAQPDLQSNGAQHGPTLQSTQTSQLRSQAD